MTIKIEAATRLRVTAAFSARKLSEAIDDHEDDQMSEVEGPKEVMCYLDIKNTVIVLRALGYKGSGTTLTSPDGTVVNLKKVKSAIGNDRSTLITAK